MPIDMPASPGFTDCEFWLETNTERFTSPLTKSTQRVKLAGDRWVAVYSLPKMSRRQAAPWKAFFLLCEGSVNTFNAVDADCKTPLGVATGAPLVKGGSQSGSTLAVDGCTPGVAGWLLAGDYFACNGRLHQLTADANTDGGGETTLSFKPAMRSSPPDDAPIAVQNCAVPMILVDDRQGSWRCDRNGIYEAKTFSAEEAF